MKTYTVYASDAMGRDLVIMDESGNKLENVVDFTLRTGPGEPMCLDVTLIGIAVNTQAIIEEVTFVCPQCEEYVTHDCTPTTLSGQ